MLVDEARRSIRNSVSYSPVNESVDILIVKSLWWNFSGIEVDTCLG